jgi:hypothetical protein
MCMHTVVMDQHCVIVYSLVRTRSERYCTMLLLNCQVVLRFHRVIGKCVAAVCWMHPHCALQLYMSP